MTLGLKSSVFLVLVVSQVTCKTFKIIRNKDLVIKKEKGISVSSSFILTFFNLENLKGYANPKELTTYNEFTNHKGLKKHGDSVKNSGFFCLKENQFSILVFEFPEKNPLMKDFKIALNTGPYYEKDGYLFDEIGSNFNTVCFLWGIWFPKSTESNPHSKIYFNIITLSEELRDRFIFDLAFDIQESAMKLNLSIDNFIDLEIKDDTIPENDTIAEKNPEVKEDSKAEMDPKAEKNHKVEEVSKPLQGPNYSYKQFNSNLLLNEQPFSVDSKQNIKFIFENREIDIIGQGNFYMMMLAPDTLKEEIIKFRDREIFGDVPSFLKYLTCKNNEFNFSRDIASIFSTVQARGHRVNI